MHALKFSEIERCEFETERECGGSNYQVVRSDHLSPHPEISPNAGVMARLRQIKRLDWY
jgi:hypothetical protein